MKIIVLLGRWMIVQRLVSITLGVLLFSSLPPNVIAGQFFELAQQSCLDKVDDLPFLTVKKCRAFKAQLVAGKCVETSSLPKGKNFGKKGGFAFFSKLREVRNENKKLVCDLGDGVYSMWGAGGKGSDNDIIFITSPDNQTVVYMEGDSKVYFSDSINSGNILLLPGIDLLNCNTIQHINGVLIYNQDPIISNGYY